MNDQDRSAAAVAEPPPTPAEVASPAALVPRDPADLVMSDDEIRRTFRVAEALAMSGAWKDIKKAEQAFAKIIIGRDLGMSPAQAMQGIHIVEGGIQMHYATLGQFIRAREGYDYKAFWIKRRRPAILRTPGEGGEVVERECEIIDETTITNQRDETSTFLAVRFENGRTLFQIPESQVEPTARPELALVPLEEEDPLDDREVYGAVVKTFVDGVVRGVSRFNLDDAIRANLVKSDKRAAWNTSRRNMFLARAMSNACKWDVPEVLNGMPVYAPGELEGVREQKSLTAGTTPDAADEGQGLDLGPKVEKIIARATELGHRGLSNRAAVEMAIGQRSPAVVKDWERRANEELDRFKAEKAAAAEAEKGEPTEPTAEKQVEVEPETVSGPVEQPPEVASEETPQEADVVDDLDPETDDPQARLKAHLDDETDQ